jgi:anti-sigma factor RsiW
MTCNDAKLSLGAYVLGTLDGFDRSEVDAHLRGCAACRAELAELASLPPLLERLSLQDLGEAIPVAVAPEDLFAKVAAQARAEDEAANAPAPELAAVIPLRRRRRVLLAAAAAVVVLAGAATAVELGGSSGSQGSNVQVSAQQGPVRMRVALSSQATGTALAVTVSGLPKDERCRLVAVADDGTRDYVGRWYATYSGDAQVTGSTSIASSHLTRLILLGGNGKQLVSVPV